ncbi:hypothetical protein NGRA_2532 [Nosema granulosis]|uniref:Uncharacterized protein n=1 Tax=Nosema granulosis TaxID=83296 RepID=A0A9P6KY20_9MICR|nr:hypothetical protein NGRA_2532 [Nosema granulosis]
MEGPLQPSEIRQIPTSAILRQCEGMVGVISSDCPAKPPYGQNVPMQPMNIPTHTPMPQPRIQQPVQVQQQIQQPPIITQTLVQPPPIQQIQVQPQTNPQPPPSLPHAPLSSILKENPLAKCQIINFLEYSGVPPPWDQLLDFETKQHHQLPDPDNLFRKIRNLLLKFDRVKNCIVEALLKIEKFIGRGKGYIKEDLTDLKRYRLELKALLKRLCKSPSGEVRNELYKRFYEIKSQAKDVQNSFYKLRDWLIKITKLFKTL